MKTKLIICGEVKLGEKGCVHQADFAHALGMERLTGWPKSMDDVQVVVGRLLKDRKPALLHKAEKNNVPVVKVDDLINDDVRAKLRTLLVLKPKMETYEKAAFDHLEAMLELKATTATSLEPTPERPVRGKGKKSKAAANR